MKNTEQLRYPIGKFRFEEPKATDTETIAGWINDIELLPERLKKNLHGLDDDQLDTPYREGGWTVRQLVHHLADSHLNAYIRTKFLLTEDEPTIMPYNQDDWAALPDSKLAVGFSMDILKGIHQRWSYLLKMLPEPQWDRTLIHPDHEGTMSLKKLTALYTWHGNHHLAHIQELKKRNDW